MSIDNALNAYKSRQAGNTGNTSEDGRITAGSRAVAGGNTGNTGNTIKKQSLDFGEPTPPADGGWPAPFFPARCIPGPTDWAALGDLRTCRTCQNLSGGEHCMAAQRGELALTARWHRPLIDMPKRCEGYAPVASDPDERPAIDALGRQRWPGFVEIMRRGLEPSIFQKDETGDKK